MLSCKIADSLGNFDAVKIATFHTSTVLLDVKVSTSSEEQKHVRKYKWTQSELGIHNIARKAKVYHH